MSLKLFHLFVIGLNSYAFWYDQMYVDLPFPSKELEKMPMKARFIFLTIWCIILQTLFFTVSFLNDVIGTNSAAPKNPPFIRKLKDALFGLSFAVAVYVSLTFWGIYVFHKDLIFPPEIEAKFPVWMNHVMHTLIVPMIFIELFLTNKDYPSRRFGVGLTATFVAVYTSWVHLCYFRTGVWAYPFLAEFTWSLRTVFCTASMVIAICFYILGERLHRLSSRSKVYANGVNGVKKH